MRPQSSATNHTEVHRSLQTSIHDVRILHCLELRIHVICWSASGPFEEYWAGDTDGSASRQREAIERRQQAGSASSEHVNFCASLAVTRAAARSRAGLVQACAAPAAAVQTAAGPPGSPVSAASQPRRSRRARVRAPSQPERLLPSSRLTSRRRLPASPAAAATGNTTATAAAVTGCNQARLTGCCNQARQRPPPPPPSLPPLPRYAPSRQNPLLPEPAAASSRCCPRDLRATRLTA